MTVGTYFLWAVADWIHSQGEGAFGLFYLGAFSFVPRRQGCSTTSAMVDTIYSTDHLGRSHA